MRSRLMLTLAVAAGIVLGLAACTPEQVVLYKSLPIEDQQKVIEEIQRQQAETQFYLGIIRAEQERMRTDCVAAMQSVWPGHLHGWAMGIMKRESGFYHAADNPSSSASGCWQLLSNLHADKYAMAGCHVSQAFDAVCNNRAAYQLYLMAGTSPWRV